MGGPHRGAATTEVGTVTNHNTSGDAAFDHGYTFGTGIKVDETFVHDGGAFSNVSTQTNAGGVGNTNACVYDVVGHAWEFVNAVNAQQVATQACVQLCSWQFAQVNRALICPGNVWQQAKHTSQVQAVRFDQTVRQQMQLQVYLRRAGGLLVVGQNSDDNGLVAFDDSASQCGLSGISIGNGVSKSTQFATVGFQCFVVAFVAKSLSGCFDQGISRV